MIVLMIREYSFSLGWSGSFFLIRLWYAVDCGMGLFYYYYIRMNIIYDSCPHNKHAQLYPSLPRIA